MIRGPRMKFQVTKVLAWIDEGKGWGTSSPLVVGHDQLACSWLAAGFWGFEDVFREKRGEKRGELERSGFWLDDRVKKHMVWSRIEEDTGFWSWEVFLGIVPLFPRFTELYKEYWRSEETTGKVFWRPTYCTKKSRDLESFRRSYLELNRGIIFREAVSISLFVGHGFCHIFGLEASFWPRFSRQVLVYVGKLHLKFREVWSSGLKVMKKFAHGCEGDTRVWSKEVILRPTAILSSIQGVLGGILEIGRYGWKALFKAYILHRRIEEFGVLPKEIFEVEQGANILCGCKYIAFMLVTVFAIISAWRRVSS